MADKKKATGLVGQLLDKAGPIIEERVSGLKAEAEAEFSKINTKLDKIIELLEK
jgi:hypothetical protein